MPNFKPLDFDAKKPLVLVNFKCFSEVSGKKGLVLARKFEEAQRRLKIRIGISVESFLIREIAGLGELLVFGQHVDLVSFGSCTGSILPESMRESGAVGSIINHSEKRLDASVVEKTVARMREIGLVSVVCVESVEEAGEYAKFKPDFIAIEPPELIGGDISVSTARPELISDAVLAIGDVPLLVGAGVKNGKDLKVALDLGAVGILVASGVCKAENPVGVLEDFNSVV
jgi:triosephosphate isomerase